MKRLKIKRETVRELRTELREVVGGISGNRCTTAHTWQCTNLCTGPEPSGSTTLNSHDPCAP